MLHTSQSWLGRACFNSVGEKTRGQLVPASRLLTMPV
jgi:hypothetical protein